MSEENQDYTPQFDEDETQSQQAPPAEPAEEPKDTADKGDEPAEDKGKESKAKDDKEPPRAARRRRRTQEYISNLKREAAEAKEQAAYFRGLAEARQQAPQELQRPKRDDFENEDDYIDAVLDHREQLREQAKQDQKPEQRADQKPSEQPTPAPELVEKNNRLVNAGMELYGDDFLAALNDPELPVTQDMGEYIFDSDVGAEVFMELADNPEKAAEIAQLKTVAARIEAMAAIEQSIKGVKSSTENIRTPEPQPADTQTTPPAKPPQKRVTNAPAPPNHERGGDAPETDESKLSDEEWFNREKKRVTG